MHGEWNLLHYSSVDQADLYQANVKSFGVTFDPQVQQQTWGSPDMGNVSKKIPSNHVLYDIGCKASNHCHAFMAAAMTEYAHAKMLIASKAMAMTAIDILYHPELPYLPVYNAGPCIIRIPISDQILRKKKNKLLNKKVKLYNIIYFN